MAYSICSVGSWIGTRSSRSSARLKRNRWSKLTDCLYVGSLSLVICNRIQVEFITHGFSDSRFWVRLIPHGRCNIPCNASILERFIPSQRGYYSRWGIHFRKPADHRYRIGLHSLVRSHHSRVWSRLSRNCYQVGDALAAIASSRWSHSASIPSME